MCQGVVTSSFYSRVESDINRINIDSLLKILNNHNLSVYDFFADFDQKRSNQDRIRSQILTAFDCYDINQLKEFEKTVNDDHLKLEVQLMLISLAENQNQITDNLKNEIHYNVIKIGDWNYKTLWTLLLTMPLYDFKELSILIASVIENFSRIDFRDKQNLEVLAHILIDYVQRSYQEKQKEAVETMIEFIMDLPAEPSTALAKVLAQLCLAKLNHNGKKVNIIATFLEQSGYGMYLRIIE